MIFKVREQSVSRRKLEALVDALVHHSGFRDPKSGVYQARNPGGLRAYQADQPQDTDKNRIFLSEIDGLQAALFDMALKVTGQSAARLTPDASLTDLVKAYQMPESAGKAWANFLKHAMQQDGITARTTIDFFLKD